LSQFGRFAITLTITATGQRTARTAIGWQEGCQVRQIDVTVAIQVTLLIRRAVQHAVVCEQLRQITQIDVQIAV
jgi:hypothetical protein